MVTIIRDRIQYMIGKGNNPEAAKPTMDYDPGYSKDMGIWTTDMFVEAVYKSFRAKT
jgi:hypothetical protein